MLVAIDQITSARTPGKKPKPKRLSSPEPERTAANVNEKRDCADERHDRRPSGEDAGSKRQKSSGHQEGREAHGRE